MPETTPDAGLRKLYEESKDTVAELKKDAGTKWKAFEEARKTVAALDTPPAEDSPEFKAAFEASKAYDEASEAVASAERARDGIVKMMLATGEATSGELGGDADRANALEQAARQAQHGPAVPESLRASAARQVVASDDYQRFADQFADRDVSIGRQLLGRAWDRDQTQAALITQGSDTSAGAFTVADRQAFAPLPLAPLTILDLITIGATDSEAIDYVRMTSFTNNAAETAEATDITGALGQKPQSNMAWELVKASTKTIAHWTPVTRKALKNRGMIETQVRQLLEYGLLLRLQQQLISGNGTGDNVRGLLNQSGILHQAAGAQSHADKSHMALTKLRLAYQNPSAFAFHPTDWETIRLSRENGATGAYLFGAPSIAGPETLWGYPVVVTAAVPQGTAIVGDWRQLAWLLYGGTQVLASDSHADFFTRNIVVLLAEFDGVEMLQYPQAFCDINLAAS